jgi:hypothetical protein
MDVERLWNLIRIPAARWGGRNMPVLVRLLTILAALYSVTLYAVAWAPPVLAGLHPSPPGAFVTAAEPVAAQRLDIAQASGGAPEPGGMTEEQFRQMLQQRSRGFGGIFAPMLQGGGGTAPPASSGGGQSSRDQQCANRYSDYAARQACKNGDLWAADRLQNKRSSGSERDWYNR